MPKKTDKTNSERLVITELQAQNIMKIKAVRICPDGAVVQIGGLNDQGKSAILTSIEMGLRGKKGFPRDPIRHGETQAATKIKLGDKKSGEKYVVDMRVDPYSMVVTNSETGIQERSSQTLLDDFYNTLTFDPLALIRMKPKEQADCVKGLYGIDFTKFDNEYERTYQDRRDINRDIDSLKKRLSAMPVAEYAEEVSVELLMQELSKRQGINKENDATRNKLEELRGKHAFAKSEVEEAKRVLEQKQKDLELIEAEGKALKAKVASLKDVDTKEIEAKIQASTEINKQAQAHSDRKKLEEELAKKDSISQEYTDRLDAIKNEKAKAIQKVDFGVSGIGFSEDGLMYNDVLFEQAGTAEQIRVGFALLAKANPKLGAALIREGSLLDVEHKKLLAELAENEGMQLWMEVVGDDPAAFIIEDGEIVREPENG